MVVLKVLIPVGLVLVATLSGCASTVTRAADASAIDDASSQADTTSPPNVDTKTATGADSQSDAVAVPVPDAKVADSQSDTVAVAPPDAKVVDSRPDAVAVAPQDARVDVAPRPDTTFALEASSTTTQTSVCTATEDIRLKGNQIFDRSGTQIVARGPEMVVASPSDATGIDAAGAMGANAARFLLTLDEKNARTPASFEALLDRAIANKMIVWVALFTWNSSANYVIAEALGGGNFYELTAPPNTGTCSKATPGPCYLAVWSRQWAKDLMKKYKGHVIIDAMQEYIGVAKADSDAGQQEWANAAQVNIKWFRDNGYTNPLQLFANYQGRDLGGIVKYAKDILAVDTYRPEKDPDIQPQTMFGWQAYWATDWYKSWQGGLLLGTGKTITAVGAINQIVTTRDYPIQVGFDNYSGDASTEYSAMIDQAATDKASWLWWSWDFGATNVQCPVSGATCQNTVTKSTNGFAGAVKSVCGM